ncbi:hypothetical protein [Paraburkholderia bannensis]|uniref:hypothetical protein n=1 Tax=Paraburkholderia bannensis TaxID=765414 RepID=UPI002AC31A25|nr:hypothetical protein [Paraburkholderia bannensis]
MASKRHPDVKPHAAQTPHQASAHKPAAVRSAPRHKLMVDAPAAPTAPAPAVSVKRASPQPHELPPILS